MDREGFSGGMFQVLKGAGLALAFSLLWAVVFAFMLRTTPLPSKVIYPVNQTVKLLCVTVGCLAFVRGEKGYLKGLAIALGFSSLSYLTFSALGGDFSLSWLLVAELALCALAGVISGAIAVNLKRN